MKKLILNLGLMTALCWPAAAGEIVTYQGRLKEGGTPVTANRNFLFEFCADEGAVSCTASPDGAKPFAVVNGLFKSTFTAPAVNLAAGPWYLRVKVEADYLAPLEKLTYVPYAVQAASASYASALAVSGGEGIFASTNVTVAGRLTVSDFSATPSTEAVLGVSARLSNDNPGAEDIRVALMGYAVSDSGDLNDILVGGNFEAETPAGKQAGMAVGVRAVNRNEGGVMDRAYGVMIDSLQNTAGSVGQAYGLYIGTMTEGSHSARPYALYSEDRNALTRFAGPVGISSVPAYSLAVSSANGHLFWVAHDGVYATKFVGDGSGLTGVTGASGTDSTKVFKTGDIMTGPLTLAASTLTVTGNAFSVGISTFVVDSGLVGVRTLTPHATFQVNGNWILGSVAAFPPFGVAGWLNSSDGVLYEGGGGAWAHHFSAYGGGDIARFGTSAGSGMTPDSKVVITGLGRVGISTDTPAYLLDVKGPGGSAGTQLAVSTGTTQLFWVAGDGAHSLKFTGDGSGLTGVSGSDPARVLKTGDTMTGPLTLSPDTGVYSDSLVSAGLIISTSGALTTTGTGTGYVPGNARGLGALDLQTARGVATQVASGNFSALLGGFSNTASGSRAVAAGGNSNQASGSESVVGGGNNNIASGILSVVPGGDTNSASGLRSFAAGFKADSSASGAFTWADSEGTLVPNAVMDRTFFKNRGGFLVSGSTNAAIGGQLDRGVFITGNGLVGISTGVPYAALDVVSSATASGAFAQVWRNSSGVIVASMSSTGNMAALRYVGDGSGLTGVTGALGTDNTKVAKAGDTMTGHLTFFGSSFTLNNLGSQFAVYTDVGGANLRSDQSIKLAVGGMDRMLIDSLGKVAINKTPANYRLDVGGDGNFDGQAIVGGTMTVAGNAFSVGGSTLVAKQGYVGIGTPNPTAPFHVETNGSGINLSNISGDLMINTVSGVFGKTFFNNNSSGSMRFGINYDETMVVTTMTRVGVGTMFPEYRLHVSSAAGEVGTLMAVSTGTSDLFWVAGDGAHAVKFTGDGSGLTGVPGDDLGTHNAAQNLEMNWHNIQTASSITAAGHITAAAYQIAGSTVVSLSGLGSLSVGIGAGNHNTGSYGTFLGGSAGGSANSGNYNSFLGFNSGSANTAGAFNTFTGAYAGISNITGANNVVFGYNAGSNGQTGSANAVFGSEAGKGVASNSFSSSTLVGYRAGYGLTTGHTNTLLGYMAGYTITTGTGNIVIGALQGLPSPSLSNRLNIGGVIFGDLSSRVVGISTGAPAAALDVVSTGTASNIFAQVWRDGAGVVVASVTSQGRFSGDGSGLTGISASDPAKVAKAGDTMTGPLTLDGSTLTVTGNAFSVGGDTLTVVNGNIGIRTATPMEALDIGGRVRISTAAGGNSATDGILSYGLNGVQFDSNDTTYMRVSYNAAHIGLGGPSVNGDLWAPKVQVNGSMSVGSSFASKAVPTDGLAVQGKVGIGTATPSALLEVRDMTASSGYVLLVATGTETKWAALAVTTGGIVGVGTLNPSTQTVFHAQAVVSDFTPGQEDVTFGVMGSAIAKGAGLEDAAAGGHFEASVEATESIGYLVGLHTNVRRKGSGAGTVSKAIGMYIDTPENQFDANVIGDTMGLFIATMTATGQTNKPYAIYSADPNARSYFAGPVGIGSHTAQVALVISSAPGSSDPMLIVSTGSSIMFGVKGNGEVYTAGKFIGDGSLLTGVIASGSVLKAGDSMTGPLTLDGSTLTVTGSAFSVGGSSFAVAMGRVGIGTEDPLAMLEIRDEEGDGGFLLVVATGTTTDKASLVVTSGGIVGVGTMYPSTQTYFNAHMTATDRAVGAEDVSLGLVGSVRVQSSGVEDAAAGAHFEAEVEGNAVIGLAAGLHASVRRHNGAAGSIGKAMGVFIEDFENEGGGGMITDTYGVYIGTLTTGGQTNLPYAVYSEDPAARSYFAGRVGISSATPSHALVISSAAGSSDHMLVISTGSSYIFGVKGNGEVYTAGKYIGDGSALTNLSISSITIPEGGLRIATSTYAGASGIVISTGGAIQTTGIGHGTFSGDARGLGAVDLQTYRTGTAQVASGEYSVVVGGISNAATGPQSSVLGGRQNSASAQDAAVVSGYNNSITGAQGVVVGGASNWISGFGSFIANGYNNGVYFDADYSAIVGGTNNAMQAKLGFIGGGSYHVVTASNSAIGGGAYNMAIGTSAVVAGGEYGVAGGMYSAVLGGWESRAQGPYSVVGGGKGNTSQGAYSVLGGGYLNSISGGGTSAVLAGGEMNYMDINSVRGVIVGGYGNRLEMGAEYSLVTGGKFNKVGVYGLASAVLGGSNNQVYGSSSTIAGGDSNIALSTGVFIGAGQANQAGGAHSALAGGMNNRADGQYAFLGGGYQNRADSVHSAVVGGWFNQTDRMDSFIGGGLGNIINTGGDYAAIVGGSSNTVGGQYAAVLGGQFNQANSFHSVIGGGLSNMISGTNPNAFIGGGQSNNIAANGQFGVVGGGWDNEVYTKYSSILGGQGNRVFTGSESVVVGGSTNTASGLASVVVGGIRNTAGGDYSFVGGGGPNGDITGNSANGPYSTVVGGSSNTVSGLANVGFVGGGRNNHVRGDYGTIVAGSNNYAGVEGSKFYASILGGHDNTAFGESSAVGGGSANSAAGQWSVVPGGSENSAVGSYSFAAGFRSSSTANGTFTWNDSFPVGYLENNVVNQAMFKTSGGFWVSTGTIYATPALYVASNNNVVLGTAAVKSSRLTVAEPNPDGLIGNRYVLRVGTGTIQTQLTVSTSGVVSMDSQSVVLASMTATMTGLPSASWSLINFPIIQRDTQNEFQGGGMFRPKTPGRYLVILTGHFYMGTTGARGMGIAFNGEIVPSKMATANYVTGLPTALSVSNVFDLVVGDQLQFMFRTTDGAATLDPFLSIVKLN